MHRAVILVTSAVIACVCVPLLVSLLPTYWGSVVCYVLLYGYLGQAWNLVGGLGRQVSLGHSAFVGTGAYTFTCMVQAHSPMPVAAAASILTGGVVAAFFGVLVALGRLRSVYFTLSSLAFAEIIRRLVNNSAALGGALGLSLPTTRENALFDSLSFRCLILTGALLLTTAWLWWLHSSLFGLRLRLIGAREAVAEATGVPVSFTLWTAITISGMLSALGGVLFCQQVGYVHPDLMFAVPLSVQCAVLAVLGGRGTPAGPLIGAVILVPLGELARSVVSSGQGGLQLVVSGAVMVAAVALFPGGVWEIIRQWTDSRNVKNDGEHPKPA